MENNILDLFTYETVINNENTKIFQNCTLLKDIGEIKKDSKVDAISIQVQLLIWEKDNLIEDTTITI